MDNRTARAEFGRFCKQKIAKLAFQQKGVEYEFLIRVCRANGQLAESVQINYEKWLPDANNCLGSSYVAGSEVELRRALDEEEFISGETFAELNYSDLYLYNPQYTAILERRGDQYVVTSTTKPTDAEGVPFAEFTRLHANIPFHAIARNEQIEFMSFESSEYQGVPAKKLIVRYVPWEEAPLTQSTIWFAAGDGRCLEIASAVVNAPENIIERKLFDYASAGTHVLPRSYRLIRDPLNKTIGHERAHFYRNIQFLHENDTRQFYLSHYGIPEPSWYRPPPPYWLYVSLASMALVIVGAVLIRFGLKG